MSALSKLKTTPGAFGVGAGLAGGEAGPGGVGVLGGVNSATGTTAVAYSKENENEHNYVNRFVQANPSQNVS
jgi:hypothetical protein